jgi:hypothetical protein
MAGEAVGRRGRGVLVRDGAGGQVRLRRLLAVVAVCGGVALPGAAGAQAVPAGPGEVAAGWGRAAEVPGLGALNTGGLAGGEALSCPRAGRCMAGGSFFAGLGGTIEEGFAVAERDGRWGKAIGVPGLAALSKDGLAGVRVLSCVPAGSCAAAGSYLDGHGDDQGFAVTEHDGPWARAIEMPGLAALNANGIAQVTGLSCSRAAAARPAAPTSAPTVTPGSWPPSVTAAGPGPSRYPAWEALNQGGYAETTSVSCGLAGPCAASGRYRDRHGDFRAFVASESNGTWSKAIQVPGLPAPSKGNFAETRSVSCAPAAPAPPPVPTPTATATSKDS